PGKYTVRVAAQGFAAFESADVDVTARTQPLTVTLKVTIEQQKVTVSADRSVAGACRTSRRSKRRTDLHRRFQRRPNAAAGFYSRNPNQLESLLSRIRSTRVWTHRDSDSARHRSFSWPG